MQYAVLFTRDEDTILARVPDLPGIFATGETEAEARVHAAEAIQLYLDEVAERGGVAPAPVTTVAMIEAAQ